MGMTHGTIAGMLLTDLILGRTNPWEALYDPSRVTLRAAGDFARENSNVALQYTDWLTGGDVASADEIPAGGGAIVRRGLEKIAVYRDEQGRVARMPRDMPAPRLRRALESRGDHLGLPLPRLALRSLW